MHYYIKAIKNYAVFSGRATRKEYWYFHLFNTIFVFLSLFIGLVVDGLLGTLNIVGLFEVLIFGIYILFSIIPAIAVTVRRLHDTNHTGWWGLLVIAPVAVNIFSFATYTVSKHIPNTGMVNNVLSVAGIIVFAFLVKDSTPGTNKYGLNPKEATLTSTANI